MKKVFEKFMRKLFKNWIEKELINFGNYMVSKERKLTLNRKDDKGYLINYRSVTDADLQNYKTLSK